MTQTLTVIDSLPLVTTLSPTLSQIIINENSANNTLSRMTVGNFASQFLPIGELVSNAGGTAAALDIDPLFAVSSTGSDGNGTLTFSELSAGHLLGNPTLSTGVVESAGLSNFLDSNFGSIEGMILTRGPSGWQALSAGTAGQVLVTQATSAPPAWELASANRSGFPQAYQFWMPGTYTANQVLAEMDLFAATNFAANLGGIQWKADVAATANTTLTLESAGASFGLVVFPASSTLGTVTSTALTPAANNSTLATVAPATPDATLSGVRGRFPGTLP